MVKKALRTFFRTLTGLIIIALLALTIVLYVGWSKVPDLLSSQFTKTLQVPVSIGDVNLSFASLKIRDLTIENPSGFYLNKAFETELIAIDAPLSRYLSNDLVIDEITLDNVYLGLEFDSATGTEGNWTEILSNAKKASAQDDSSTPSKRTVLIRSIVLTNINTDVVYRDQGGKVQHLKTIKRMELKNISSEGGAPVDQIMNSALGEMLKEVFIEQNIKNALNKILQPPGGNNPVQEALQQLFK